jgi:CubicO group peptidase (beta-lactamase class C family)
LRKLLSHSSSIAVDGQLQSTFFQPGDTAFAKETLTDMCFKYLSPNTSNWLPRPPGNVTLYSNEGTSLAALVVERVTKIPYDEYVKENILKPLNIDTRKTGVRLSDFSNLDELVKHYGYAVNSSFLQQWDEEMPQLNIIQLTVNVLYVIWCFFIIENNFLYREIFQHG